jgi:hypothetical protein
VLTIFKTAKSVDKMKFSYVQRFPCLFAQIKAGGKPVCFFDQDGTVTIKTGADESAMTLNPDVIPAVEKIIAKGGIYVPSSARSLDELKDCYAAIPDLPFAANDGFVISLPGLPDMIYSDVGVPDYSVFQSNLSAFTADMTEVTKKDMGAYFGLFVDSDHPRRGDCEKFFADQIADVSARSNHLPMVFNLHPMGITMEPRDNCGKARVIDVMFPLFKVKNPILIAAGDAKNDIPALKLVKERNGHAIKVHKGSFLGIPEYATAEVFDAVDCVGLLKAIADAMGSD